MDIDDAETPTVPPQESGPHLKQLYAFGFERIPGKNKQFVCIDENTVAYALGCNVVIHSIINKTMQFVHMHTAAESILAITSTPSGKLLAACLRMKSGPGQVAIVETKKQKIVHMLISTSSAELEVCALSKNEQRAVAVTKNNKGCIMCWELVHGKVLTSIPIFVEITCVTVNPHDDDEFASSGPSHFRVWSLKGGQTKSYAIKGLDHNSKNLTLADHNWLQDGTGIAVATLESGILIARAGELQNKLKDAGRSLCVVATSTGLLSGGADGRLIAYQARGRPPVYSGNELINFHGPITCISLPPNSKDIAYIQQEGKVLKLDYSNFESEGSKDLIDLHAMVDLTAVSGMDICVRRRLLATCSTDKVVRLWNYSRILCELTHICEEQPSAIAISPWGYELLVGISCSTITVFRIMLNRLEPRRELALQGCGQMKYSPSGSIVAVLCGREIVLYSCFTWEVLAVLQAHIGKVISIAWSRNSLHLASVGADGALYSWSMDDFKRHEECVIKGSQYSGVLYDNNRNFIYTCGPQLPLRVVSTRNKPPADMLQNFPKNVTIGVYDNIGKDDIYRGSILCELPDLPHFGQLVGFFHKRLIFAIADYSQALHAYAYPLSSSTVSPVLKLPSQAGRVASMCIDEKHNLIFVRTTVGTIFICTSEEAATESPHCLADMFNRESLDEYTMNCLLVTRAEVDTFHQEVQDLRSNLQAEQDESRYRQHRIRQDWSAKIRDKEKEAEKREWELCQEIQLLKEKLESAEKNLERSTQSLLQAQSRETASLYEHFEGKFTGEAARAEHWRIQAETIKEESVKQLASQEQSHYSQIVLLEEKEKHKEVEAAAKLLKLKVECERDVNKYKTYMEEDSLINDEELDAALSHMKQALHVQQNHLDDTRSQLLLEKKAVTSYQMQISDLVGLCTAQESNIRALEVEKARLENFTSEFDYKRKILDKLVEEADEHRKKLLQATKERETLATLQHSKIQQLVEKEKPLVEEIARLKTKIQEMQTREALDSKHRHSQEEAEKLLRERISDLEQRGFRLLDQLHQREEFLNAFKEALCVIVHDHDPVEWPPLTRGLFLAYVKESERAAVAEGLESRAQIMKQRQILEDFVIVLKSTIERNKERCKEEVQHYVKENLNLLRDYSSTNRNVRRMAFMVQKLQHQVAYFKGIVSMQKRTLAKNRMASDEPRRSITDGRPRASISSSADAKKMRASQEEEALKLGPLKAMPLAEILKPYSPFSIVHGGQEDRTRTLTPLQIDKRMRHPWQQDVKRVRAAAGRRTASKVEELTKQLNDLKVECLKKQEEIVSLQHALKRRSVAGGGKSVLIATPVRLS